MPVHRNRVADPLFETRTIGLQLHRAALAARADFSRAVHALGLTAPMARVLLLLDEPTPMRRIAELMYVDASYVTGVADKLEVGGFLERISGADRRVKLLMTTAEGAIVRTRIADAVTRSSTVLKALNNRERAQLSALLERLTQDQPEVTCDSGEG